MNADNTATPNPEPGFYCVRITHKESNTYMDECIEIEAAPSMYDNFDSAVRIRGYAPSKFSYRVIKKIQ